MDEERISVDLQDLAHSELGSAYAAICEELHLRFAQTVQQAVQAALTRAHPLQRARAVSELAAALPLGPSPGRLSPAHGSPARLSEREREVLQRIAVGDSNKLIARALGLSPHTVKRHVANILDKLDVRSRGEAAARVLARH